MPAINSAHRSSLGGKCVGWENEAKETRLRGKSKVQEGSICTHRIGAKLVPKWTKFPSDKVTPHFLSRQVLAHVLTAAEALGRLAEPCCRTLFKVIEQTEALIRRSKSIIRSVNSCWRGESVPGLSKIVPKVDDCLRGWKSFPCATSVPSYCLTGDSGNSGPHCLLRDE